MPFREKAGTSVPVEYRRFASLDDAELWLTSVIGPKNAFCFAADLLNWGPRMCSDGWHADMTRYAIEFRTCDCAEQLAAIRAAEAPRRRRSFTRRSRDPVPEQVTKT